MVVGELMMVQWQWNYKKKQDKNLIFRQPRRFAEKGDINDDSGISWKEEEKLVFGYHFE